MTILDFDTAEAAGLDGTLRSGEIAQQLARTSTATATATATATDEPTVRDVWQETDDMRTLDTTVTPDESPVSLTLRAVLSPYVTNSSGEPITWEYAAYRTYHAAGTPVPEMGPWIEVDRQQGWDSEDTAKTWAENKLEMVEEDWEPERDVEYAAKVEQVTAVRQAQAARDDRLAIDKIATLLGTSPEWSSAADFLSDIANVIGSVRPHPGDKDPDEYAAEFLAATGHTVHPDYDNRD